MHRIAFGPAPATRFVRAPVLAARLARPAVHSSRLPAPPSARLCCAEQAPGPPRTSLPRNQSRLPASHPRRARTHHARPRAQRPRRSHRRPHAALRAPRVASAGVPPRARRQPRRCQLGGASTARSSAPDTEHVGAGDRRAIGCWERSSPNPTPSDRACILTRCPCGRDRHALLTERRP